MELNSKTDTLPAEHAETIVPLLPVSKVRATMCAPRDKGGQGATEEQCPGDRLETQGASWKGGTFDGLPWGLWQARTLLLAGACKITTAWHMATVLYAANPSPFGVFGCSDPVRDFWDWTWDLGVTCDSPRNASATEECLPWTELGSVNQWSLACRPQFVSGVSQLSYLLGIWLGGMLCLYLVPRVSPRCMLLAGLAVQAADTFLLSICQKYLVHVVLRALMAVACVHVFTAAANLCADISTGMAKKVTITLFELGWSFGILIVSVIGVASRNWTAFQAALAVPAAALWLPCFLLLPESPSWLVARGRLGDAAKQFQRAAALSRQLRQLPPQAELLRQLQLQQQAARQDRKAEQNAWRAAWADGAGTLARMVALHCMWGLVVNTFYGSLLNVRNLGNPTMYGLTRNMAASGAAGVAGILLGGLVACRTARPWVWLGLLLLSGGSVGYYSHLLPLQDDKRDVYILLHVLCQRVAVSAGLAALGFCTAGLAPTSLRSSLVFTCSAFGRFCLLYAPFVGNLVVYSEAYPLTVFGLQMNVAGLCALLMAMSGLFKSE